MIWSQSIDVVYYLVFLCVNLCTLRNLSRSHVFLQLWDFHEYYISCVSAYANDLWKNPFVSSLINEAHCICMLIYLEIRQTLSPGILLHASSVCYCCEGQICSAFCVSCYSVSIRRYGLSIHIHSVFQTITSNYTHAAQSSHKALLSPPV